MDTLTTSSVTPGASPAARGHPGGSAGDRQRGLVWSPTFYHLVVLLVVLCSSFVAETDACVRSKDAEIKRRPTVKIKCPSDIVRVADVRSTEAQVSWQKKDFHVESTNPIKGIHQTLPNFGASVNIDQKFPEGKHRIEYKAIDSTGNLDSCSFHVTVKVVRCTALYSPQFGSLHCDEANLHGSRCRVSCVAGYSMVGPKEISCRSSGQWSHDTPFCRTTTCPDPGTPLHGSRNCTTATHAFGSTCHFACARGFHLQGAPLLVCNADKGSTFWSSPVPVCEKIEPPRVDVCPNDIHRTSGKLLTPIEKPEVRFLTYKDRIADHTCSHFGADGFHNFTLGIHRVICVAFDRSLGDEATAKCEFTVRIKANPCRSLSKPLHGFLMCSSALGGGSPSHETTCTLTCNSGYIPARTQYNHDNAFTCDHTGNWTPSRFVPSCVRPKRPLEMRLPSEIFYHSSNCSDGKLLFDIQTKFQNGLQTSIRQEAGCKRSPGDCIVEDVKAQCRHGVSFSSLRDARYVRSRRRKRIMLRQQRQSSSSRTKDLSHLPFQLPILFDLATRLPQTGGEWPDEYHRAHQRLFGMFDYFEELLHSGQFSIGDQWTSFHLVEVRDSLTHAKKKAICDRGYQFNHSFLLCVPCGAGTHYSGQLHQCVHCAPGFYQDEAHKTSCKQCPAGTASPEEGATKISQCVDLNECESNPCHHGGLCINSFASFSCVCTDGYSGTLCEEEVYSCSEHSCLNGGTCVPMGAHNHSCSCRPGYSGFYCQFHTINGGWGEWSEWSPCSKSCEGGVTTRKRICNSPSPTHGGEGCNGADTEDKVCNLQLCPKCKRLRRPYQGSIKCTEFAELDYISCAVRCPSGYDFSSPVEPVYGCGKNTSYLWPHESPDNPRCVIPACTEVTEAREVDYQFKASWAIGCDTRTEETLRSQIQKRAAEVTEGLDCLRQGSCQLNDPVLNGCSRSQRQKRDAHDNEVKVIVTMTYFKSNELNTATVKAIGRSNAVEQIESLGHSLLAQTRNHQLTIEIDGQKLSPQPSSVQATNVPVCPSGTTPAAEGQMCVECQPGSYYLTESRTCVLCDLGSYQPLPGQEGCLQCSANQTTYGRGAMFAIECYEKGSTPPEIPEDYTGQSPSHHIVFIGIGVSIGIVILMSCTAFVWWRRRRRKSYNVKQPATKSSTIQEEMNLFGEGSGHSQAESLSQKSHRLTKSV